MARWRPSNQVLVDIGAVLIALGDVMLAPPSTANWLSRTLSALACVALIFRRRFPLAVTVVTFPGFLIGWAEIAAMIALYTLARSRPATWRLVAGVAMVWIARFVMWPLDKFFAQSFGKLVVQFIHAGMIAGMPTALGLLVITRLDLSRRIAELAASRVRERRLHAHAVRTEERARLAREMHDLVSHQVTLIAMQAGALQVAASDENSRHIAKTIRQLSKNTLDELRELVGLLRTAEGSVQPGVDELGDLVETCGVEVTMSIEATSAQLPSAVSSAAYRTVQEALTNIRKHAPGAPATVGVSLRAGVLQVEVRNDPPPSNTRQLGLALSGGGNGLLGLRERATLLGGSFEGGPTDNGGYLIRTCLPLKAPVESSVA